MALPNVPKTNWETDDGVTFTDMNEIGENIQDLEDDKYESGDSPTFEDITATSETVTTSNITTANITTANITTLNMLGAINPTETPTATSQAIGASSAWVPTRGNYIVSDGGTLQILVSASWRTVNVGGGAFMTDGSNVRVFDHGGSGVTVYYLKF